MTMRRASVAVLCGLLLAACHHGGGGGGGARTDLRCSGTSATGQDLVRFDCPATSGSPMAVRVLIGPTTSPDVYTIKFDVVFDPAVLAFDGPAIEGNFLNQDGNPTVVEAGVQPSDPGRLVVSVSRLGVVGGVGGTSGEKTVVTLPFMGVASGSTMLTFENDEAVDSSGTPIVAIQFSGPVDVTFQ